MKYLITESQINNVVFWYLNNQDFVQIKIGDSIYFVNSEGDVYAQIRYDEDNARCVIDHDLVKEISSFFSIDFFDSEQVIGRWVENTIKMMVKSTRNSVEFILSPLRIPYE